VNGHTHTNQITAHGHATPERAFWEINTAAHVDYPQHARVVEIADNGDGTLSLFTTLVDVDVPCETDYDDFTAAGLAWLGREFAFDDPHRNPAKLGTPADRNTELLGPNDVRAGCYINRKRSEVNDTLCPLDR
jgi:hypothetical protein